MVKSVVVVVVTVAVLVSCVLPSQGREFKVGGEETSWKLPSSSSVYSQWAQRSRFLVGDVLVWKYDGKSDSVLEVTKQDYDECNTWRPIATYEDGNTKMTLKHSGAFYFISGARGTAKRGRRSRSSYCHSTTGQQGQLRRQPSSHPRRHYHPRLLPRKRAPPRHSRSLDGSYLSFGSALSWPEDRI